MRPILLLLLVLSIPPAGFSQIYYAGTTNAQTESEAATTCAPASSHSDEIELRNPEGDPTPLSLLTSASVMGLRGTARMVVDPSQLSVRHNLTSEYSPASQARTCFIRASGRGGRATLSDSVLFRVAGGGRHTIPVNFSSSFDGAVHSNGISTNYYAAYGAQVRIASGGVTPRLKEIGFWETTHYPTRLEQVPGAIEVVDGVRFTFSLDSHFYNVSGGVTEIVESIARLSIGPLPSGVTCTSASGVFPGCERRATPTLSSNGIINGFSGAVGGVAPGEIVSLFGTNLGPGTGRALAYESRTGRLPIEADGVSVLFNNIAAPLYYVSAGQINVQVPYELRTGQATLVVRRNDVGSTSTTVPVLATHPGLFPGAWNQDGSRNSAENPAEPGSVVVMFGTGQGITSPASLTGFPTGGPYPDPAAPVRLEIGGREAVLLFKGQAPQTSGVFQLNAAIPGGVRGEVPVKVFVGGTASQEIRLFVR